MACNVSSDTATTEVITDSRESPLLLRGFRDIDRPATRQRRNLRVGSVRYRLLKWIALSINAFFAMGGCLGVCATLWALSKTSFLLVVKPSSAGVYLLMVSIALLFLSGVLGFVGVLKHNSPVIGSYIVLVFISLIISLLGSIWTYTTATQTDELLLQRIAHIVLNDYGKDLSKTATLDIVQQSFQCCGSASFTSWVTSAYSLNHTNLQTGNDFDATNTFTVPKSCCVEPASQSCGIHRHMAVNATTNHYIYTKGCVHKLQATIIPYGNYALCVSLIVGILQIAALTVSFILFKTFRYYLNTSMT